MLHRRSDRDELREVGAPFVTADLEPHADDAVGAELVGLLLHAGHRQLPRVVHGLGEDVELLVLVPSTCLEPDVVDRAADDEPKRIEACFLDEQELVHGQVAREEPWLLSHPGDALAPVLGHPCSRGGVVRRVVCHSVLPPSSSAILEEVLARRTDAIGVPSASTETIRELPARSSRSRSSPSSIPRTPAHSCRERAWVRIRASTPRLISFRPAVKSGCSKFRRPSSGRYASIVSFPGTIAQTPV